MLALLLLTLPKVTVHADTSGTSGYYQYTIDKNGACITKYTGGA
jgi:hypothetical protein